MLITDGAMEDFKDVFEEFNWPERRVRRTENQAKTATNSSISKKFDLWYFLQVRVFTYLIGREMTFAENVKWIACNNKGKSFPFVLLYLKTFFNEQTLRI